MTGMSLSLYPPSSLPGGRRRCCPCCVRRWSFHHPSPSPSPSPSLPLPSIFLLLLLLLSLLSLLLLPLSYLLLQVKLSCLASLVFFKKLVFRKRMHCNFLNERTQSTLEMQRVQKLFFNSFLPKTCSHQMVS